MYLPHHQFQTNDQDSFHHRHRQCLEDTLNRSIDPLVTECFGVQLPSSPILVLVEGFLMRFPVLRDPIGIPGLGAVWGTVSSFSAVPA
jgi:hypothetical protein